VTRFLIEHVPPSCVTACDLDPQAVRFCAAEFGVKALHSKRNLGDVQFPEPYDLIFVGSLLTHLPDDACLTALQALAQALCANGLLVFTTQGESCLGHLAGTAPASPPPNTSSARASPRPVSVSFHTVPEAPTASRFTRVAGWTMPSHG
jgi:hypothetical protein